MCGAAAVSRFKGRSQRDREQGAGSECRRHHVTSKVPNINSLSIPHRA